MSWMIQGGKVLLSEGENFRIEEADIAISGSQIEAVGKGFDASGMERVISGRGKLVIPGLINAHLHSHDRFDKGRFDNLPLEIWMSLYNPPYEDRRWTPRLTYLRTLLNGIELLRSGTTTAIDDVHHGLSLSAENAEAVFQAYQDLGLRAFVSAAYSDRPFYQSIPYLEDLLPRELKERKAGPAGLSTPEVLDLWDRLARGWQGRVSFVLAPSGPQRCTSGFLQQTWQLAEKHQIPVITHVLETKIQAFTGQAFYGMSLVEYLESLGLLNHLTVLVHAVWVSDLDIERIARGGAAVVHNPGSNLKLGSGIAPLEKLLRAGIPVGLGTDNNNANDSANLFEAMKLAALIHKVKGTGYEDWPGAREAFRLATMGGAACAHSKESLGRIEAGRKADMVILNLDALSFFPQNNLLNQLVYSEQGGAVETVIVDGELVLDHGQIMTLDERSLMAELREVAGPVQEMIAQTVSGGKRLEPYLREAYRLCMQATAKLPGTGFTS